MRSTSRRNMLKSFVRLGTLKVIDAEVGEPEPEGHLAQPVLAGAVVINHQHGGGTRATPLVLHLRRRR